MSEAAVKALLSQPNAFTKKGLRDSFLMLMMYDTGARIQGVLDIRICDIKLGKSPTVTLLEKGSKTHPVPLMKPTVDHLKNYMKAFHPGESVYSEQYLFYTICRGCKTQMDQSTVRKFMAAYANAARERCPEIPPNVHPHMLRHSRAMHLYQHGMDLTLVSQWLGHAQLDTTLIYAHADTEHKRTAIEAASPAGSPLKMKLNSKRFTVTDDETLKKLYGMKWPSELSGIFIRSGKPPSELSGICLSGLCQPERHTFLFWHNLSGTFLLFSLLLSRSRSLFLII